MKKYILFLILFPLCFATYGQQYRKPIKPVKNVILMIPDGTSIGVVSSARWYQKYNGGAEDLNIDPYLCGTVQTFSVNAPIGDSAPTTSCYMTGIPQRPGNISIYPLVDPVNDLYPLDSLMSYQPLMTLLEAAKYEQGKAVGLVATCEFPHATPADCASHHYSRKEYEILASQMAYNNLDVMFVGGTRYVSDDMRAYFGKTGTRLLEDDVNGFRALEGKGSVWALFGEKDIPYDLDRDSTLYPSLAEMTEKAIDRLSENENGFFLMVEGSKIDWAAHANDAIGCITEYLAFDEALGVAMRFAVDDGETVVVVMPDHGNSGFTLGRRGGKKYSKLSISELFENVSQYKKTAYGMEELIRPANRAQIKQIFKNQTNIDLNEEEVGLLWESREYKENDYMEISNGKNLESTIVDVMNSYTYFGFTSGGHTGEEVFLAAYHPAGESNLPIGKNTNVEMNSYMFDALGLKQSLMDNSKEVFAKHQTVFKDCKYNIDTKSEFPVLTVSKGKNKLVVPAFKSVIYLNGKEINIGTVTFYIDKNDTFYLPDNLIEYLR